MSRENCHHHTSTVDTLVVLKPTRLSTVNWLFEDIPRQVGFSPNPNIDSIVIFVYLQPGLQDITIIDGISWVFKYWFCLQNWLWNWRTGFHFKSMMCHFVTCFYGMLPFNSYSFISFLMKLHPWGCFWRQWDESTLISFSRGFHHQCHIMLFSTYFACRIFI